MQTQKIILGTLLTLVTVPVFASNWYAGVGVGPEAARYAQDATISSPGHLLIVDKSHPAAVGVFGSIFGGYAYIKNQFYLAGEANFTASSASTYNSNSEYFHQTFSHTQYSIHQSYGLSVLPGYFYNDSTLFFVRLGLLEGQFKSSTTDVSLASRSTTLTGFRYGLGLKEKLNQRFSLRMEYSQVSYDNASFTTHTGVLKHSTITPLTGQVEFAIVYDFA